MRLPVPATALVGREVEVRAACDLLQARHDGVRLLTLVGAGGVGKTRLALAVASAVEADYQHGVAFVDLSALRDPRLLAAAIADVLELSEPGGRSAREVLLEHLRERQLLLVLDTFEHLAGAVPLLTELLEACPRTALVVTSRTALRIRAEHRFQVEPLPEAAAMQLFGERAQAVSSGFALTPENTSAVAAVCRQLEGIPLAIELAAARTDLLGPQALLGRLERRLPLLTGGGVDLPSRHQTLRDALAWSHDLLGVAERTLFRRLAVFEGGWTLEAAEAVVGVPGRAQAEVGRTSTGTILDVLSSLVGASLVRREDDTEKSSRFRMLDTIREYADERLVESGEADIIRSHHRDWYLAWAEQAVPELTGPGQAAWYRRLTDELDNLRAARAWSRADPNGAEAELRLAAALGRYWNVRAPGAEARAWLSDALARGPATPSVARTSALIWSGQMECVHGRADLGEARLCEAVAVARQQPDPRMLTLALRHLALYCSDIAAAQALLEEAVNVARAAGDWRELALALAFLGIVPEHAGQPAAAEQWYTEALAAARTAGDPTALANVLLRLGGLMLARGEPAAATACLTEAAATSEAIGYGIYLAEANRQLAQLALDEGDAALAGRRIRASLEMVRASGRGADALWPLRVAAHRLATLGEPARAAQLFGAEATWRARHLSPVATLWTLSAAPGSDEDLSALRRSLGEQAFAAAWATGSALTLDEAVAMALEAEPGGGGRLAGAAQAADTAALGPEALPPSNIGPPPVRARLVRRQRLLERLDTALAHVVTLVAAPAGFGKTSALVDWEAHVHAQTLVAWVSLTPADTDPARFWRSVLAGLQAQHPTLGAGALGRLQARAPVGLVLDALLRDLAALDRHLALVLDDYHVIQTPAIHAAVAELLSRCPAVFHLVIGTRSDPPLPLARLRANGQLVEIRAADLRFSESEAAALLGTIMGLDLSSEHVAALSARTEGWAAGLQLAALTLRERSDVSAAIASFAGSDRFLIDYFVEEVLARLPSRARAFLERTSILYRLSGPLCDAVIGVPGSGAMLEELERANVFITPADSQCTWYRYHQLFAGTLRHRLERDEPELVPKLHERASEWYSARGLLDEAVEHALAGERWDRAADLIGSLIVPLISRGEHLTIERWLTSVPDEVAQHHPVLSGYRAASLLLAGDFRALEAFLAGAELALGRAGDDRALGRVLSIHAQLAAIRDEATVALACAARALSLLPPGPSGYRTTALAASIRSHILRGNLDQAVHVLAEAVQATPSTIDAAARWELGNLRAYCCLLEGKLHRAAARYDEVLREVGERAVFARQAALLGRSVLAYEWNRLDQAGADLDHVATLRRQAGRRRIELPFAALVRGRLLRARGQLSSADQALERAEQAARQVSSTRLQRLVRAERAWVALLDGRLAEAMRWAKEVDVDRLDQFVREPEALMLARVRRAQGTAAAVVPLLGRMLASAQKTGRGYSIVAVLVQLALGRQEDGDHLGSLAAMEQAVTMAEPEAYVRVFLDEGEAMLLLLRRVLKRSVCTAYVGGLVRAFRSGPEGTPAGVELLTPRERDVLRLLAVGLSNRAIAERLVTSEATVKSHVHRLIGKLGVASRAQVMLRARELGNQEMVTRRDGGG